MKTRLFVEEFRKEKHNYFKLEEIVSQKLEIVKNEKATLIYSIEHRVKNEESLNIKISRYGEFYQSYEDLHDLFGARIICYFSSDIDLIANYVATIFDVDFSLSTDKRTTINPESFGYLSVHYICSLKKDEGYPEELTNIKFEVQIKTMLQHTWAMINHDLGYKSDFGVPRVVTRQFARIASLLEIADDEFVRAKNTLVEYENEIHNQIINDVAEEVLIDIISLKKYMYGNKKINSFLNKLAQIENSEIEYISPESYMNQLKYLGINTIGDLQRLLDSNEEIAYQLAKDSLLGSNLDIISSNIALRFLCISEVCLRKFDEKKITEFLLLSVNDKDRAKKQAKAILEKYNRIIN